MDKIVYCVKCQKPFALTREVQQIYHNKRVPSPKRCADCLLQRKRTRREEVERQRRRLYDDLKFSNGFLYEK